MISGLILAAGLSKRMGSPKQSIKLAGRAMLDHAVDSFLASELSEVVVVIREGLSWERSDLALKVVVNPNPGKGISESLRVGLGALDRGSKAAIVGLGDKPLLHPSTINALISAYSSGQAPIVVPVFRGTRGNPVLFDKSLFTEMLKLRGDSGAKVVVESHEADVLEVPVKDEGILLDVNTPSDVEKVEKMMSGHGRSGWV